MRYDRSRYCIIDCYSCWNGCCGDYAGSDGLYELMAWRFNMWWEPIIGTIGLALTICIMPLAFYQFREMLRDLKNYYK